MLWAELRVVALALGLAMPKLVWVWEAARGQRREMLRASSCSAAEAQKRNMLQGVCPVCLSVCLSLYLNLYL